MGAEEPEGEHAGDIRAARNALRREFPETGILYDTWTGRWKAVWGKHGYTEAASADDLRQQLRQENSGP